MTVTREIDTVSLVVAVARAAEVAVVAAAIVATAIVVAAIAGRTSSRRRCSSSPSPPSRLQLGFTIRLSALSRAAKAPVHVAASADEASVEVFALGFRV